MANDPMTSWDEQKQRIAQRFSLQIPHSGGDFSGASTGAGFGDRIEQTMSRGRAPLTGEGLLAAVSNAGNLMGGTGALMTGATSVAEMAAGKKPGEWGGLQDIPGYERYDRDLIDAVKAGHMTLAQADHAQVARGLAKSSNSALAAGRGMRVGHPVAPEKSRMMQAIADYHGAGARSSGGQSSVGGPQGSHAGRLGF